MILVQAMEKTMQSGKAIAYLRTSSAANVGADKDSDKRQRAAIEAYARRERWEIVEEFYDADVSGADPIETRPGFSALLDRIEGNGVRTVLVEDASRFAASSLSRKPASSPLSNGAFACLPRPATISRSLKTLSRWRCGKSRGCSPSLRRLG
jgi:hypothetical protein